MADSPPVITLGKFPVCATPITDSSLVGPGTNYPIGFTQAELYALLKNYNWQSVQISCDASFTLYDQWLAGNSFQYPTIPPPVPQIGSLNASFGSEANSNGYNTVSLPCGFIRVEDVAQKGGLDEASLRADCSGSECQFLTVGGEGITFHIETSTYPCYLLDKLYYPFLEVTAAFTVALGSLANSYGIIIIDSTKTQSQLTAQVQDSGQQMGYHYDENVDPNLHYVNRNPITSDYNIVTITLKVAGKSGVIYGYTGWNTFGNGAIEGDPSLGTPYTATASASVSVSQITINPLS